MAANRLCIATLLMVTLASCRFHELAAPAPLPREPKQFFAVLDQAEPAWNDLQRDVQAGRFWMHWHHLGRRVAFSHQPMFDEYHNPVLVSIWKTPLWCHVTVPSEQLRDLRATGADSCSVMVVADVQAINWYTKHIWLRAMLCEVDACN